MVSSLDSAAIKQGAFRAFARYKCLSFVDAQPGPVLGPTGNDSGEYDEKCCSTFQENIF